MQPSDITVFTAVSRPDKARMLVDSCIAFDAPLVLAIIEQGEHFETSAKKLPAFAAVADQIKTEWVLYLDGYDTLLLGPLQDICNAVACSPHLSQSSIIVNAEKNCWPAEVMYEYESRQLNAFQGPWRYLNAGACLARVETLLEWHRDIKNRDRDQLGWQRLYLEDPERITLDHRCSVLQTGWGSMADLLVCSDGRVRNLVWGSNPCVLHLNGKHHGYGNLASQIEYRRANIRRIKVSDSDLRMA